jgi:hypothetical protein
MTRRGARDRVSALCLALPEATSEGDRHLGFSVRGRRFAWLVDDHHGDGRLAIHCKAPPGENTTLAETDPARYFLPPYLARRGWAGAWLDVGEVDWERVEGLLVEAYRLSAPERLAAKLDPSA